MKRARSFLWRIALMGALALRAAPTDPPPSFLPSTMTAHPWNVFVAGEFVRVPLPAPDAGEWRLWDYDGRERAHGTPLRGWAEIGTLPTGYYEVHESKGGKTLRVSLAVLWPVGQEPPLSSPVSLDVASAWRFGEGQRVLAANLCHLAGINWVRDRCNWIEMEPARAGFAPITAYDVSVAVESSRNLRVLEVNHFTPRWANPNAARFPLDLRDAYRFYRTTARRWQGRVAAFEPWNEPDIDVFGGHAGSQIAAFQKAAYLGIKAGNSNAVVCQTVFATPNDAILDDFQANDTWPYFDTFNFHSYAPLEEYPAVFAEFRSVSAGKPMWLTECNLPLHWSGDPQFQDLSDADARTQAERLPKVYASALFEGVANIFYFTLAHYAEGQIQYGLLHADDTPLPGVVSLAAVGKFLATARPLGRVRFGETPAVGYCFRITAPEGPRDLLVLWSTNQPVTVALPSPPAQGFDLLGRTIKKPEMNFKTTTRPVYLIFPEQTLERMFLEPPPRAPMRREGPASPVVFQPPMLHRMNPQRSAYRLQADKENRMPIEIYNFSDHEVEGDIQLLMPTNWTGQFTETVRIPAGGVVEEFLSLRPEGNASETPDLVRLEGDFGPAGHPVLSFRAAAERFDLKQLETQPIPSAMLPRRWEPVVSGTGTMKITQADGGLLIEGLPGSRNRYVHPKFELTAEERMDQDCVGVEVHLQLIEGKGTFYVIFEQGNGSSYLSNFDEQPAAGESMEGIARVDLATWGSTWSNLDDKSHLEPSDVRSIELGCSTDSPSVKFLIKDLRWLKRPKPVARK